jgi:hypothetical protein
LLFSHEVLQTIFFLRKLLHITIFKQKRTSVADFFFNADPDPASQNHDDPDTASKNDEDPDPQH